MNIVFMTPHTRLSGGVKVIFRLANGLQRKGHKVTVIARKMASWPDWLLDKISFNLKKKSFVTDTDLPPKTHCVINFSDGTPFLPISKPQILFLQGFGVHQYEKECVNLMYSYAGIIATSSWLAKIANGASGAKVHVVPPGVDDHFEPKQIKKSDIVGAIYHNLPTKNTDFIIKVFENLPSNYEKLLISVEPIKDDKILNIPGIRMVINPPQTLLPFIYSSLKVFISASIREGFGLPPLEAMKCGCPVVMCKNSGLNDFVKHGNNCMIANLKVDEFVNMCIQVMADTDDLYTSLVNGGKRLAGKFSWSRSIDSFERALKEIL